MQATFATFRPACNTTGINEFRCNELLPPDFRPFSLTDKMTYVKRFLNGKSVLDTVTKDVEFKAQLDSALYFWIREFFANLRAV